MAEYIFESEYKNKSRLVKVRLFLVHFEDENDIYIIYSPHLDLSGYGDSLEEAKKSLSNLLPCKGLNEYVSEIFDKYPVNTFHQDVNIPVFV